MLKKKCFAALSGILLAISLIAPFSFSEVFADGSGQYNRIFSFENTLNGGFNMYCDYFFGRGNVELNGTFVINLNGYGSNNHQLRDNIGDFSWAIIDADGVVEIQTVQTSSGSGSSYWEAYQITLTFSNCTYCDFRIVNYSFTQFWTTDKLKNKSGTLGISVVDNTTASNAAGSFSEFRCLNTIRSQILLMMENGVTLDQDAMDYLDSINTDISAILNELTYINPNTSMTYTAGYYKELTAGATLYTSTGFVNNDGIAYVDLTTNATSSLSIIPNRFYRIQLPYGNNTGDINEVNSLKVNGFYWFNPTTGDKSDLITSYKSYIQHSTSWTYLYLWDAMVPIRSGYKIIVELEGSSNLGKGSGNCTVAYWNFQQDEYYDLMYKFSVLNALNAITSGLPSSNSVVNDNDQQNSEAVQIISQYDSLTSTFDSSFQDSQTQMTTILQNTSLTQFTDAATWFTAQLFQLYQSLGSMQILVAMPLILGVALFFIGRGNVVFRDPNTETWNETYIHDTYSDGSESVSKRQTISYQRRKRSRHDVDYF